MFALNGTGARLPFATTLQLIAIRTAAVHTTRVMSARNCGRAMPRRSVWAERTGGVNPAPQGRWFVMTPSIQEPLWPSTPSSHDAAGYRRDVVRTLAMALKNKGNSVFFG